MSTISKTNFYMPIYASLFTQYFKYTIEINGLPNCPMANPTNICAKQDTKNPILRKRFNSEIKKKNIRVL